MARFKTESGKHVSCELLNESQGKYVVKFNTGVIRIVDKECVSNLDRIDEGVLDVLKDKVNKYGRTVVDTARKVADVASSFIVNIFSLNRFVFFKDENDSIIESSHPANSIQGSKLGNCVNFIPGDGIAEVCEVIGIKPEAVENFTYDDVYNGAVQFDEEVSEGMIASNSLIQTLFEDVGAKRLAGDEKISLHGEFADWNQEQITNYIANEYMSRYKGIKPGTLPLMIWGAPGIGKTSIIRSLRDIVKKETGKTINIISVNGGNVGPDDFTMPATVSKSLNTKQTVISDLPKNWLPVYNPMSDSDNPEVLNAIANGGIMEDNKDVIENGPGGIFFIDEYSRMTPSGMDALMQTPTTREIGSNSTLKFGDRWVIVCAANRKSDMSRRGGGEALSFEGASKTRFNHCNFVPSPKDWIDWASSKSEKRQGRNNILTDIISYIESEIRRDPSGYGDFYEMWKHPSGELNGTKGTSNPRTWEALSETIIDQYFDNSFGKRYSSISEIAKNELIRVAAGIVGKDVAERFADFVAQFSTFKGEDAKNVWTKGNNCQYMVINQHKLNSANIEEYFTKHIFPMLKDYYPGGFEMGNISPDAALNFMKFLEACCYDAGQFNLNRFKNISTIFGAEFGVDLRSTRGVYSAAANYKEDVIAKNELV